MARRASQTVGPDPDTTETDDDDTDAETGDDDELTDRFLAGDLRWRELVAARRAA
jgi:hypothetical protein